MRYGMAWIDTHAHARAMGFSQYKMRSISSLPCI